MEYSPMMVVMLWALTPSDCLPIGSESGEQARVVEMPQPIMSVRPEGYFTFNHGQPFLAERDPLTGAIDANIKTTPVTSDDYLYEEYEESGESIDRKDTSKIYTRNDITSPSKDSDLHKFLNLPVHYSSSGKFPLISSSYANTKVQGHGPLSNHKLYSSSSSTTSTVSPSYYPHKTASTSTTTAKPTTTTAATTSTSTSTSTSTEPTTQRTTTTTRATATTTKATTTTTRATTTTSEPTKMISTVKSTTTSKPVFPSNYEYEYEYDYDKNDGEPAENSSHDYEFLGASSEVTNSYNDRDHIKHSTTLTPEPTSSVPTLSTSSSRVNVTTAASTNLITSTEKQPQLSADNNNNKYQSNSPKYPVSSQNQPNLDDTIDLKPPKPELSVELKPPQSYPTRPFSSVLPTKQHTYNPMGFVRYPDSSVSVDDRKPVTVYLPENTTKIKSEVPAKPAQSVEAKPFQEEKPSTTQSTPQAGQLVRGKDQIKEPTEDNFVTVKAQNNVTGTVSENVKLTNATSLKIKVEPEKINSNERYKQPTYLSNSGSNPIGKDKDQPLFQRPESDFKRPSTGGVHTGIDQLSSNPNKHHELLHKPEYRPPPSFIEDSNVDGLLSLGPSRPMKDHRPSSQDNVKFSSGYHGTNFPGTPNSEVMKTQRPLDHLGEQTRLPVGPIRDNRPVAGLLPLGNRPPVHYNLEHNRPPPNYHLDTTHQQTHSFGMRITERPLIPDRAPEMEIVRNQANFQGRPQLPYGSKKPGSNVEVRPHLGADVRPNEQNQRPEGSSKPITFSKPLSAERPDYNTLQFGQPSKVENHFISVSSGNDNPSYSLQTSFSIGVPPPDQKPNPGGSQGVGQVLFPDEEPEKKPLIGGPLHSPTWPPHPRPQQVGSEVHPNIPIEKYPRPPWESHLKSPYVYHKKDQFPPIKRKPLPNILPQFRPNAKIGHAEPHVYINPREPHDTLQPPPLPRPQYLRLEQEIEETMPLVHRRNGQSSNRVTTLQMMQGPPASKRATLRIDDTNEKNEPVFVVYPSNGANSAAPPPAPSDGVVVVGTRGPQRPLPPDNLDIGDDLDSFPLDNNKNFQARVDTPVLKSKPTSKPVIKNDFPYTLIKPNAEEKINPESVSNKEYTAFSPTVPSIEKDHDTEVNIIPYLQDYMPFATKKPTKDTWLLGTEVKPVTGNVVSKPQGSEITTVPLNKKENHRIVSEGPQPQDFQAPFHASLTAPSQGWSVVQKKPNNNNNEKNNEESTTVKETNEITTTEESKFDIQNFKPQLFGGFKPIVPPVDGDKKKNSNL